MDVDVDIKLLLVAFYQKSIETHGDGHSQFASRALVHLLYYLADKSEADDFD